MPNRTAPYPSYIFILYLSGSNLTGAGEAEMPLGGFSNAGGLPQKVTGLQKLGDVTLKRGVVNSSDLWNWINSARGDGKAGRRDAILTQRDAVNAPLTSWRLRNATPKKYTGPTLGGKGGGDLAIEELILSVENIEVVLG